MSFRKTQQDYIWVTIFTGSTADPGRVSKHWIKSKHHCTWKHYHIPQSLQHKFEITPIEKDSYEKLVQIRNEDNPVKSKTNLKNTVKPL